MNQKKRNQWSKKEWKKYKRPKRFGPEYLGSYKKGISNPNIGLWHKMLWIKRVLGKIPVGRNEDSGEKIFDDSWEGFEPEYILKLEGELVELETKLRELRLEYEAKNKENQ